MPITDGERDLLRSAARAELARRNLLDFATLLDPGYVAARHVQYLCGVLEALERNELKHLIVLVPPRHGKTRLVSQFFPAWWLGRHPADELILASNTSDLAEDNSAQARNLLLSDASPFDTSVSPDTSAKSLWRTTAGGVVRAAGIGSAIQGRGGNLLICDDPIAGSEEATDTAFERQWKWFVQDFFPRRLSESHVILSMFRWGDRDLAGEILNHDDPDFRKEWTVIRLPAYAGENDPLGRPPGEVLWPTSITAGGRRVGYGIAHLETQRKSDLTAWQAQYELDPVPAGGALFRSEWLENRYDALPASMVVHRNPNEDNSLEAMLYGRRFTPPRPLLIQATDSAWKSGVKNDRSVVVTIMSDLVDIFIADVWFDRVEYPDLRRAFIEQYNKWKPSRTYVEEAASGFAIVAELRASTNIPIIGVRPSESKIARASSVTGLFEAGRVKLPKHAPWLSELLNEMKRFPFARHDDICDAVVLGVQQMWNLMQHHRANERFNEQLSNLGSWMAR